MTSNPSKSPPDWASNHWVAALLHALPLQLPLLLLISKKNFQKPHQQPPSLGSQSKVQTHHDPPHSPSPRLPPLPLCSHLPPLLTPSATAPHHHPNPPPPLPFQPPPTSPKLAYFISGTHGDSPRLLRLLGPSTTPTTIFAAAENVNVVGSADAVNLDGSTPIASLLRGAAILLRYCSDWDWFVNLEASDYPLISQDDLLHILSFVPRDFNFIEHTSNIGWNEYQRIIQIVVDPGLYLASKRGIFLGTKRRVLPRQFRFFTGKDLPHITLQCSGSNMESNLCYYMWKPTYQL
ncbi:Beta-glucuronosyltransferase GlcAT14C [Vitis vinifera]|uniref:Beta-glucuronosyltransferase GlcAT14C n=1 Tax=Vitis vinifera TaxID=29760 RepID=A0A438JXA5_VITVI|nr:Beta-glucuronosyltransferase GlcAT14C [Vitis vinifera]